MNPSKHCGGTALPYSSLICPRGAVESPSQSLYPRLAPWAAFFRRFAACSISWGLVARLKSCPSRSWRSQIPRGMGRGIPCLAKDARPFDRLRAGSFDSALGRLWGTPVVVASAYSRFLTGLSARFGMTRFFGVCGTTEPVRRYGTHRTSGAEAAVFLVILDAGLEGLLHPSASLRAVYGAIA